MKKAKIEQENWEIEAKEDNLVLRHDTRSGNHVQEISFESDSFGLLYNVVLAIAQLHPEWLQ